MWGCLHGLYLCINHAWIALKNFFGIYSRDGLLLQTFSRFVTFIAVVIAWVFFRAPDFSKAYQILHAMFFEKLTLPTTWHFPEFFNAFFKKIHIGFSAEPTWVASHESILLIFVSLMIVWFLPNSYQLLRRYKPALLSYDEQHSISPKKILMWKPTLTWNFLVVFAFVIGIVHIQASSIFLYFRF